MSQTGVTSTGLWCAASRKRLTSRPPPPWRRLPPPYERPKRPSFSAQQAGYVVDRPVDAREDRRVAHGRPAALGAAQLAHQLTEGGEVVGFIRDQEIHVIDAE